MILVEVCNGPQQGQRFELLADDVLGRVRSCAVVVKHASISRRHARIERAEDGWFLVDLESVNGIRAGGRRVERAPLLEGEEVALGEVRLLVLECPRAEEEVAPAPATSPARPPEAARRRPMPRPEVRHPARPGLLGWDLEQVSPATRFAIVALAAGVAVGVAWGAYRLAIFLRAT